MLLILAICLVLLYTIRAKSQQVEALPFTASVQAILTEEYSGYRRPLMEVKEPTVPYACQDAWMHAIWIWASNHRGPPEWQCKSWAKLVKTGSQAQLVLPNRMKMRVKKIMRCSTFGQVWMGWLVSCRGRWKPCSHTKDSLKSLQRPLGWSRVRLRTCMTYVHVDKTRLTLTQEVTLLQRSAKLRCQLLLATCAMCAQKLLHRSRYSSGYRQHCMHKWIQELRHTGADTPALAMLDEPLLPHR